MKHETLKGTSTLDGRRQAKYRGKKASALAAQRLLARIDPEQQRRWELKIIKEGLEHYEHEQQNELNKEELEVAMYFFTNQSYIMMVHFERQNPKLRFQEDFFYEETRKNREGFAVVNLYLPPPGQDGKVPQLWEMTQ